MNDEPSQGFLDGIHHRFIHGWAVDGKDPGKRVRVNIIVNGALAGSAIANRFRPDLVNAGFDDGRHGFEFPVPIGIQRVWSVAATVEGTHSPLAQSTDRIYFEESDLPLPSEWISEDRRNLQPALFVLGAAKSGTSALHDYLGQHPDIFMSDPKEPFYFEAEYDLGSKFYFNRYFSGWAGERIAGESRHRNLYLPYIAKRIYSYNPEAKLVAILRNPIERAVSHWWHWYSREQEALSLREALEADESRILSGESCSTPSEIASYSARLDPYGQGIHRTYLDSGYYSEQLDRYVSEFGKERLFVILYEDFVKNPREVMADLFGFLECRTDNAELIVPVRSNESAPGMVRHLDQTVKSFLLEHFRDHNRNLESFLGRSLSAWDHPFGGE
jgi:Sulfotransferase domain